MRSTRESQPRIDAYLDGEMDRGERAAFERELSESPELQRAVAARRALDEEIRALPPLEPSPWFEARFRARLAQATEAEKRRGLGALGEGLRRWGWAVAGPAIAAAALLLVVGDSSLPEPDWELVSDADGFELVMAEDPDLLATLDVLERWSGTEVL